MNQLKKGQQWQNGLSKKLFYTNISTGKGKFLLEV